MMTSHLKNDTAALLPFLTQHELAELQKLSIPPSNANGCVKFGETDMAEERYIEQYGYAPPMVIEVSFVQSPHRHTSINPQKQETNG